VCQLENRAVRAWVLVAAEHLEEIRGFTKTYRKTKTNRQALLSKDMKQA
jgi:hypothetical protein